MGISRAQYIAGNSNDAAVLTGQPQGVTQGFGVTIATDGTISVDVTALPQARVVNLGVLEAIDGLRVTFTLTEYNTSTPYLLNIVSNLAVFLGGVPQLPGSAYTVLGNSITFDSPPPSGTTFLAITVAAL